MMNPLQFGYGYRQQPAPPGATLPPGAVQQGQASPGMEALKQAIVAQQQNDRGDMIASSIRRPTEGKNYISTAYDLWRMNRAKDKSKEAELESARQEQLVKQQESEQAAQEQQAKALAVAKQVYKITGDMEMADNVYEMTLAGVKVPDELITPQKGTEATESTRSRQERVSFLKENPEIVSRIGQEAADKFLLTGNWGGKGMSLTVGPDGTVMFSEDGSPVLTGPTTSVRSGLQEKLIGAEEAQTQLSYISEIADPNFLTVEGWAKAKGGKVLDKLGIDDESVDFNSARSAFVNRVLDDVMQYRKLITGVAGGEKEMQKIESMRANPNMGPAEFARNIEEQVRDAQRDANVVRRTMGLPEEDWPEYKFKWGGKAEESKQEESAYEAWKRENGLQ